MLNKEMNMTEQLTENGYMTQHHPDAFVDYEKMKKPDSGTWYECPTCKGYGGWNLRLNCYKNTDIPAHRHFRCLCSTCHGWGYTMNKNQCEHEWEGAGSEAMFLHRYKCTKCGVISVVDSSG